jgi:creatinine amidohydrolase
MAKPRPWILSELCHADLKERKIEVAVLPLGATEPHNLHMPYGTDCYQLDAVAEAAGRIAHERGGAGAKVVFLPTLPFGVNTNYFQIPGGLACSLNPSTMLAVVRDIVDSMVRRGVRKVVLLNGHGGNEIKPILRELHAQTPAFLCLCDWYRVGFDRYKEIFDRPGEHADEMETSMGLAFFPDLMRPLSTADAGAVPPTMFEAINKGWVAITRPWHVATTNTGVGDPSAATADKGRRLMETVSSRLADFLAELAAAEPGPRFPYK